MRIVEVQLATGGGGRRGVGGMGGKLWYFSIHVLALGFVIFQVCFHYSFLTGIQVVYQIDITMCMVGYRIDITMCMVGYRINITTYVHGRISN